MGKTQKIQVRIDGDLKDEVSRLFADMGIDMSAAVRIFFKKCLEAGGLPFSLGREERAYDYLSMMDNIMAIKNESRQNNPEGFTLEQINAEIAAYRNGKEALK